MTDDLQTAEIIEKPPEPSYIDAGVLEDEATHPAYMNLMAIGTIAVAILGLVVLGGIIALSWNEKPVPEALTNVAPWVFIILGVLLVGETLLGKLTVKE